MAANAYITRPDDPASAPINGTNDPTQSVFRRQKRPLAAGAFVNPAAPAPGTPASPAAQAPSGSVFDNLRLGAGTGLDMPTFAGVADSAQRASAAAQDKAAAARTFGDPSTFAPGSKPPVDIRMPVAPVFSPDSSASTIMDPMGRSASSVQPPVVASSPAPAAVAATPPAGSALPGAAGRMASAIPAVATTGPAAVPGASARALADGGVVQPDGSIAFSNIAGQPGAMSQDRINALSKGNVIPAAAFTNPGLGVASSEASGGAVTPGVSAGNAGFGAIQNPSNPAQEFNSAVDAARADNRQSTNDAVSDLASIAGGDWRTASGTAARNAAIDLKSELESAGRWAHGRGAADAVRQAALQKYLTTVGAMPGAVVQGLRNAAGTNQEALRGDASLGAEKLNKDAQIAMASIYRPGRTQAQIPMADGSLGLLGPDGVVRKAVGEDGKPINVPQVKEDAQGKRADSILQDIYKSTDEWRKNLPPGSPDATPDQITKARIASAQTRGFTPQQGKDGKWYISIGGQPVQL